jgi:P-type Ca2+ transporter type 2C
VPVRKRSTVPDANRARPGDDDLPFVFSGTLVTQGVGIAPASATGPRTEIGRIGKALQAVAREPSGIEIETRRAVVVFAALSLALCALVTVAYGVMRDDWLHGLLAGITLASLTAKFKAEIRSRRHPRAPTVRSAVDAGPQPGAYSPPAPCAQHA